jgi:DtxR family Mn-dependent transcriptional regulator
MKISDTAQELLEQLWVNSEEKSQRGLLCNDALPEDVEELLRLELVKNDNNYLFLTPAGVPEAARSIRRHRLAERLLADVLMMEEDLIDEQACRLEHTLFNGLDESICTLLGHPRFCPHGQPIPPGECCQKMQKAVEPFIVPLCRFKPGQWGQIAYIQMNNPKRLQKLMAMNVLPGVSITLLRHAPSYVFEVGHSQFAVDEEIAADIYVRINGQ